MHATYLTTVTQIQDLPKNNKPQIAFVGRSNVGKSSLINHLTQQKNLARVSAEAGRTKTINLFDVDHRYLLVDLPGYGYAKTSKEQRQVMADMVYDYLWQSEQLKLVFLIIDARIGPTELDCAMMERLAPEPYPIVMILNKADKLSRSEMGKLETSIQKQYPGLKTILHSSLRSTGRADILREIENAIKERTGKG